MAVLIEALSVVVRINKIRAKFLGGLETFKKNVPNKTSCMDSRLARVGFMSPADVGTLGTVQKVPAHPIDNPRFRAILISTAKESPVLEGINPGRFRLKADPPIFVAEKK